MRVVPLIQCSSEFPRLRSLITDVFCICTALAYVILAEAVSAVLVDASPTDLSILSRFSTISAGVAMSCPQGVWCTMEMS